MSGVILLSTLLAICSPGVPAAQQPTCVTDGDTFRLDQERIRIENIDTPELQARCPEERQLALQSRDRLRELLEEGFEVERTGRDRFNRTLARVSVQGVDVGEVLVREQLARPWTGRRLPWC